MVNRPLLAKVLGLLGSSNDGEALNAARRADAMVKAGGTTWTALLGSLAAIDEQPEPNIYAPMEDQIARALMELKTAKMSTEFRSFVNDCGMEFDQKKYLNPNKRAKLFDGVRRARAGQGIL